MRNFSLAIFIVNVCTAFYILYALGVPNHLVLFFMALGQFLAGIRDIVNAIEDRR